MNVGALEALKGDGIVLLVHWPDGHTTKGIEKHIEDQPFYAAAATRVGKSQMLQIHLGVAALLRGMRLEVVTSDL